MRLNRNFFLQFICWISSMRVAIMLLLLLVLASVASTLLPQNLTADKYGVQLGSVLLGKVYSALGLEHIVSAPWFITLIVLVCTSTFFCIVKTLLARQSFANKCRKLAYFATHVAIILICIGGFLSAKNRRSIVIDQNSPAFIADSLPFSLSLDEVALTHYPSGQIKQYTALVNFFDKKTNSILFKKKISVNNPLSFNNFSIYLAGIHDFHSNVDLRLYQLNDRHPVNDAYIKMSSGGEGKTENEIISLSPIVLEDMCASEYNNGENELKNTRSSIIFLKRLVQSPKNILPQNFSPSIQISTESPLNAGRDDYKYYFSCPFEQGTKLLEVRSGSATNFTNIKIPVDFSGSMVSFIRLAQALKQDSWREWAANAYAQKQFPLKQDRLARQDLKSTAYKILTIFVQGFQPGEPGRSRESNPIIKRDDGVIVGFNGLDLMLNSAHLTLDKKNEAQDLVGKVLAGSISILISQVRSDPEEIPVTGKEPLIAVKPTLVALDLIFSRDIKFLPVVVNDQPKFSVTLEIRDEQWDWLFEGGGVVLVVGVFLFLVSRRFYKTDEK